ncbi:hypothetical protein TELCIR_11488 [Teladorsagia circumcincta]|uniref:DUF7758 domain-containing protein n=1 Tax=Teladorsagia circumcincta TaxID=45464 RepID=A0A2G9U9C5_TELCI|nr:hypothetical protein TELCIR_11488 [Teladorsagia circumcincta]
MKISKCFITDKSHICPMVLTDSAIGSRKRRYEAAIYACYYRLGPIITDSEEKRRIWTDMKREYAQIFLMGRRIWRRASHPSRLIVLYNMATLCVRFGSMTDDSTSVLFRETLADRENFDYRLLDEVQFAKSVDKITLLENHVIDQFYIRRRSSGSFRSSFRSKRPIERTPSGRSTKSQNLHEVDPPLEQSSPPHRTTSLTTPPHRNTSVTAPPDSFADRPLRDITSSIDNLALKSTAPNDPPSGSANPVPCLKADFQEDESVSPPPPTHRVVHFSDEETSDVEI